MIDMHAGHDERKIKMTYTIEINAAQQALIYRLLAAADVTTLTVDEKDEHDLIVGMLHDLPDAERSLPGTTHCFHL